MPVQSFLMSLGEENRVIVAHLVRAWGRKGEIIADILTDFPERFAERRQLWVLSPDGKTSRAVELESYWLHKGRVVLKFAGIDSISDAEALRGYDVAIPHSQRAPLEDGSVYIDDLIGCHVIEAGSDASDIGLIVGVDRESASTPLLIVRAPGNKEDLLIPFVKAWLRKIDLEQKCLEMSLPEGLLSINSPENNE